MELAEGVFVSNIEPDEWKPDPEVGGEMHVIVEVEGHYAGISRFRTRGPEPDVWTLPERETILVLEGTATIEIEGGPTLELKTGDLASIPKGAVTTWHKSVPFRNLWFFGVAYEMAGA
jgi:quercetin dioxygenase-like cupin family protein